MSSQHRRPQWLHKVNHSHILISFPNQVPWILQGFCRGSINDVGRHSYGHARGDGCARCAHCDVPRGRCMSRWSSPGMGHGVRELEIFSGDVIGISWGILWIPITSPHEIQLKVSTGDFPMEIYTMGCVVTCNDVYRTTWKKSCTSWWFIPWWSLDIYRLVSKSYGFPRSTVGNCLVQWMIIVYHPTTSSYLHGRSMYIEGIDLIEASGNQTWQLNISPFMDRFPFVVSDYQTLICYGTLRWARKLAKWLVSGL